MKNMFCWMLELLLLDIDVDDDFVKYCFFNWFKIGDGIFWVFGKVGLGKLILMKFFVDYEII